MAMAVMVSPPYVAYVNPTGITDIAFERENMQQNIKNKQAAVALRLVKPLDILAKLFALMPVIIPTAKKIYPDKTVINFI